MWDGRVFKYAKSGAANYTMNVDMACKYHHSVAQAYDEVNTTNAIGDTSIIMDGGTHDAFTEDELAGGYVIIYKDGGGGNTQFRGIAGNEASAENADVTVYLDAPVTVVTVGATTSGEIWHNPYGYLGDEGVGTHPFAGKPAVQITTANTYFWVQTWGLCWLSHNSTDSALTSTNQRCVFRHDGSYEADYGYGNIGGVHTNQIAGHAVVRDAGPLLYLTIST